MNLTCSMQLEDENIYEVFIWKWEGASFVGTEY
jgi:hypothetical protein